MGLPDEGTRIQLFECFLRGLCDEGDIPVFGAASERLTGADIRQISEDAVRNSILAGSETVSTCDVLARIAGHLLSQDDPEETDLPERIRRTRDLNSRAFTYRRIAEIHGVSLGYVSKVLNLGDRRDAGRTETPDQGSST